MTPAPTRPHRPRLASSPAPEALLPKPMPIALRSAFRGPLHLAVLVVALAAPAAAQGPATGGAPAEAPLYIGASRPPIRVSTLALYQRYASDGAGVSQLATPVAVSFPLTRTVGASVRAGYAAADADGATGLSGLADVQLGLSAFVPLGGASAAASVRVNLPSGQTGLSAEQARTAFLVGQGFYGFAIPSLGQGLNATPGVTLAFPLGDRLALGAGAAYQYRGAYRPTAGAASDYDPGDEVLLTLGADYQLDGGSALTLDVSYAHYLTDTYGGLEYRTGDAVTVRGQWAGPLGRHWLRVLGRFRSKGESDVPALAGIAYQNAAVPTHGLGLAEVQLRLGRAVRLGLAAQGRYYAASDLFEEQTLVDLRLAPEVEVMRGLRVVGRAGGTVGGLSGLAAGIGLTWEG